MDTSSVSRVVPVSDVFVSRAAGKVQDSEMPKENTVSEVKDVAVSNTKDRKQPAEQKPPAAPESKFDGRYVFQGTTLSSYTVSRKTDPDEVVLEISLKVSSEAYDRQQQLSESAREDHAGESTSNIIA